MKKTYIQPSIEQFVLTPACMLAASGGSIGDGGWSSEELPDDYEEIEFGEGSRIPD